MSALSSARRCLLASCLVGACGGAAPTTTPMAELARPSTEPELAAVTRDAARSAERQDWTLASVAEPRFAVEGRPDLREVAIPAGECRAFVLVSASGVQQAAAALYLADGRTVARDTRGDPPMVGACAGESPLTLYWHVSIRGAGLVRGLTFSVPEAAAGQARLAEPRTDDEATDDETELALALRRRGFVRRQERRIPVTPGQPRQFPIRLAAHRCLTLWVTGVAVSLRVLADGVPVAREGAGGPGALQLCSGAAPLELVGEVETTEPGAARVRQYEADEDVVGGEEGLWLGERRPPRTEDHEPSGAVPQEMAPGEAREVALQPPESGDGCVPVHLSAGEGSRGVWLETRENVARDLEACLRTPWVRFGSVGGGRVWLRVGGEAATETAAAPAPTPRRPARRAARP